MVHIELSENEAQKVANWLQESFNLLEVGGSWRISAIRLMDSINEQLSKEI